MGKVHVRQVDVKGGFRSLVGPISFSLPATGMVLLKGVNRDTGGSSGSGKSSLLHAINYGFECCPFPANTHQSWFCEEPYEITYHLDTDQGPAVLVRGPKPSLKVGGKKVSSATAVAAKLRELTGYDDPKMLAALTYRAQQERGLFLNKTDSEKKEFLTALLGLERFEREIEVATKRVTTLEANAVPLQAAITRAEGELAEAPLPMPPQLIEGPTARIAEVKAELLEARQTLDRLGRGLEQAEIDEQSEIEKAAASIEADLSDLDIEEEGLRQESFVPDQVEVRRLEGLIKQCSDRIGSAHMADVQRKHDVDAERYSYELKIEELRKELAELDAARAAQDALQREIEALRAQTCPTCERTWQEAANALLEREERLKALEAKVGRWPEVQSDIDLNKWKRDCCVFTPDPKIEKLQKARQTLENSLAVEREKVRHAADLHASEIRNKIAEVDGRRNVLLGKKDQVRNMVLAAGRAAAAKNQKQLAAAHLHQLQESYSLLVGQNNQAEQSNTQAQADYDWKLKAHERAQRALVNAQEAAAGSLKELAEAKDWLALLKGYIGSIFDEVLADISHETNRILAKLPNTAHCLLHFRSEVETQAKVVKKKIVPVVTIRGVEAPYKSGCSGGMISVVELAVDLAVGRVVQRRTGCAPGWLILDESFEGLGPVEKESCLEMLREYAEDRLILVVDHASEFKEMFSQTIVVEYQNGISRLA